MRVIISHAKKMNVDTDSLDISGLSRFHLEAEVLKFTMRNMNIKELQDLWACNATIAERSFGLLWEMDLRKNLTPAILSYEGRIIQKGTLCKMARGRMVRWLAENNITRAEDIMYFDELGYRFRPEYSTGDNAVFIKSTHPLQRCFEE